MKLLKRLCWVWWRWVEVLLGGLMLVTLLAFGGRWFWRLDLVANGRPQFLLAALLLAVVFGLGKRWYWGMVSVLVGVVNVGGMASYFPMEAKGDAVAEEPVLRVMTVNVLKRGVAGRDLGKVRRMLEEAKPDMVALQETGGEWRHLMQQWQGQFPQQSGARLYAAHHELSFLATERLPWRKVKWVALSEDRWSMGLEAEFELEGRKVSVLTVHSYQPVSAQRVVMIRRWHEGVVKWVKAKRDAGHAVVVLGDFNCTPWMSIYRDLLEKMGLKEAGRGHPFAATWGVMGPLRMMIDHVFVGEEWRVNQWQVLGDIESDHRPVLVEMQLMNKVD